jgi:hypothetical protein
MMEVSIIKTRIAVVSLAWLILLCAGVASYAQLSGQFGLDLIARRIPTTLTGEIVLDTPSEFVMLEFAIASQAILNMDFGPFDLIIDATVNTAGPEHLVLKAPANFGGMPVYEIQFDRLSIVPEIWFAVPFEAVSDVNNLPNSVIIPPGDVLFVKSRVTFSTSIAGFNVKTLLMMEDVNFPSPGTAYAPLTYPVQSQSFAIGSLTSVSWRSQMGISISASLGMNASASGTSIKGYSATGSVLPDNFTAQIGIGGIKLSDIPLFGTSLQSVTMGTSFAYIKTPTELTGTTSFAATISLSAQLSKYMRISSSVTLHPGTFGGVTLSLTAEPFRLAFALDTMSLESVSASISSRLNMGAMTGSWGASATGLERGMTGASVRLSLAQGIFSTGTSVSFAQRGEKFGFASWASTLIFRFSPSVVTVQATFGRYGLTRAAVSAGVAF